MQEAKPNNPQAKALADSIKPRITDEDCAAIEVFKDNDDLVMAFRNLLLGFELSDKERYIIEDGIDNDETKRVIKKFLLPELEPEIALGQNIDLWMTTDITNADEDSFELVHRTKMLLIGMLETSLERLEDTSNKGVRLSPDKDLAFLKARIAYVNHTSVVINDLIMNANRPITKVDKSKNSNK